MSSSSDALPPETTTSESTGRRRTESYLRDKERARTIRAPRNNPRLNAISKLAYGIAGSPSKFYRLAKEQRLEIRETAAALYDLGCDFATAQKAESTEQRGFVYVIDHPLMNGVKVGRAFNPESRLRGYQTGCPRRSYRLRYALYFKDCHTAEAAIHARLNDHQLEGEWFAIAPDEAQEAIEAYGRNV